MLVSLLELVLDGVSTKRLTIEVSFWWLSLLRFHHLGDTSS